MWILTAFGKGLSKLGIRWSSKLSEKRDDAIRQLQEAIARKNKKLFINAEPQMKIGSESVNGAIFKMKKLNPNIPGPRKVMKIVKSPGGVTEFEFQKSASRLGLSPKVYNLVKGANIPSSIANAFFMNKAGPGKIVKINAFTMNNLQQTNDNKVSSFHNYMKSKNVPKSNKQLAFEMVQQMVRKLGNYGISHGDLHARNVYVVISKGNPPKLLIIDFGRSWRVHSMNTRRTVGTASRVKRIATGGTVNNNIYGKLYYRKRNDVPHIPNYNKLTEFRTAYRV